MSTLSIPSGSYRSPASRAFTTRLQRPVFHSLHAAGSAGVAVWSGIVRSLELQEVEPTTPEELLAYAGRFETTQPSYAADLRAAALRHME